MIVSQDNDEVELILNAGHNEYVVSEDAEVVWDPYDKVAEVDIDKILAAPHNQYLWYDEDLRTWGTLVKLKGTHAELEQVFTSYVDGIGAPSGDDDTFDYWPSAMRQAWEFAIDLESMSEKEQPEFINRYYALLDKILKEEYEEYGVAQMEMLADEWAHVPVSADRIIKFLVFQLQRAGK